MNALKTLLVAALLSTVAVASFAQNARSGTLPAVSHHHRAHAAGHAHRGHHRHHHRKHHVAR